MRDQQLRQYVIDELDFEPSVNSAHIGVAVENGVVTLSGHVGSYVEKLAAEKAARRVKGVRAIAEEIEVRFAADKKVADDQIAGRALNILDWNTIIPRNAVKVKVQDGWIDLSGEVEWQFQRTAAEQAVRRLSGVTGVVNHITIKQRIRAEDVKRRIDEALKRNAEIKANGIQVSVEDGGSVALDGYVQTWLERAAVERAAWSVPGVNKVEDRLMIP